jgi:raffinose/stachyose/melibiose transport system permease protein
MIAPVQHKNFFRRNLSRLVQYVILTVIVILIMIPIVMVLFAGLKTRGMAMTHPYTLPIPPQWTNFTIILSGHTDNSFWLMLRNSVIVMLASTSAILFLSSLAAFVFARMKFPGKDASFNFLTLGLMFPINIAILPIFLVMRQIHLTDSLLGVILVQTAFGLSGNILILRGFFMAIPSELQDAAYIDGCNDLRFFYYILLPMARPALAAVASLAMIVSWNDLLTPLVLINKDTLWTLPLGTMQFQGQYGQDISLVSAFVCLSALPTILFYLLAERQIVSGLTAGAVKG